MTLILVVALTMVVLHKTRAPLLLGLTVLLLSLLGCTSTNYGDDQYQLRMATHGKDIMWMPTKVETTHEMLTLAGVRSTDILYDLGSGDGVIPIEAAKLYGVRAYGIEYNPDLVALSIRNAQRAKVQNLVSFKQGDIFVEDFSQATVLTLFLGESLNTRLMPTILKMKPGTRVVSNTFRMESWIADREIKTRPGEIIYLWIVPANIDGLWVMSGLPKGDTANLVIRQKKQFFDGSIDASMMNNTRRTIYFEDGRISGQHIEFAFKDGQNSYTFKGQMSAGQLTGILNNDPKLPIIAKRPRR
ncbi:MAG: methyltransferase domain-containing protein [Limnohabitans sp.]|nr:methyltransferase domain-containing protein [Limnohabitans sp.]